MNFKAVLISFVIVTSPFTCTWADIKLGKGLDLGTLLYFKTDQDRAMEEYFSLGTKVGLEYELEERWEFQLEIDAGTDRIRVDEIWGKYQFDVTRIKFGVFKNTLVIDDLLSSRDNIYAEGNPVQEYLSDSGWYSPGAVGIRLYRNYDGEGAPISAFGHLYFQPTAMEPQMDAGLLWAYSGEDSFLGLMAAYFPYFVHDLWAERTSTYIQNNNFLFDVAIADFSEDSTICYKAEVTLGNNLIDPVGYVHFPGEGEPTWFFGASGYAGFPVGDEDTFRYTPGVNLSYLMYQMDIPESNSVTVRWGNKLEWRETFFINVDLGLGINTYYDPSLVTALEVLWGITMQVHI